MIDIKLTYMIKRIVKLDYSGFFDNVRIVQKRTGRLWLRVFFDMVWCGLRYGAGYKDYTVLRFYLLNGRQRRSYLTRAKSNELVKKLNGGGARASWDVFDDKVLFLRAFAPFVQRAWVHLPDTDEAGFAQFLGDRRAVIAKPLRESGGVGITRFDAPFDASGLYAQLVSERKPLVEAFIEQHEAIAAIYAGSVNTVRFTTVTTGDDVDFLFSGLRVGNGGIIDNISNGGMVAQVDLETGRVVSPAFDKAGDTHERHPATGTPIVGFTVPLYEQAKALIRKAALVQRDIRYVGWDVVICPDHVELLEGNQYPGHEIMQIACHLRDDKMGILPRLERYM